MSFQLAKIVIRLKNEKITILSLLYIITCASSYDTRMGLALMITNECCHGIICTRYSKLYTPSQRTTTVNEKCV